MNRPRTLIGLLVFFSFITFILWGVGDSISNDEHIRTIASGGKMDYGPQNMSYGHLWQSEMESMGIMKWQEGEYDLSDRIDFKKVYHSTHSYGDKFMSSSGDSIPEKIANWLTFGWWDPSGLEWNHDSVNMIHEGEHIYIYPHLDIDLPDSSKLDFGFLNLKQYIFVRTFDAYSVSQEWLHEPDTKNVQFSGDRCEWIPQLNCGEMGKYTLYYVIDVAYFDQDFLGSIPGVNLLTNRDIEEMIKEDKALFMEQYGGVILGDENLVAPSSLSYHEITYQSTGGINTFFDTIKDIQMGWTAFTSTDNEVVNYGFTLIMAVFTLIFGLSIYYEIKSYLPFISGGDGGE